MRWIDFIKSRLFLKHLALAIGLTIAIVYIVILSLNLYTHHGESYTVPDFIGMFPDELKEYADNNGFEFIVIDSIYDAKKPAGSIILQDPFPNSKVKKNRKIYLTIVTKEPEKVSMPNLIDLSLRQSISLLETYGLQVGSLEYIPDIAKNAVIQQKYQGKVIQSGELIKKGSRIDLVVGQGMNGDKIQIPFLIGKKQSEVLKILRNSSLNIGNEIFEDTKDTSHARVYIQEPIYAPGKLINMGGIINVIYRSDKKVKFDEVIRNYQFDTSFNN
jgi:beta-lactam-binding protein with PASTA domain